MITTAASTTSPSTTRRIQIVPYDPRFNNAFAALNKEWIEHYFDELEEEDLRILNDPQGYVIQKGGEIFFAIDESKKSSSLQDDSSVVVGCAAMIRCLDNDNNDEDNNSDDSIAFELGKMAVAPNMRRRGIARLLMDACQQFAREQGAREIYLLSDDSLPAAIDLYLKSGFVRLPKRKQDQRYARGNVEMRLKL